ncbi:MAG: flagellar hook-length control protein FliK [Methylibium sp.]|nr:flagellar hook-length control protein FliK [Methylibium sp.]MBA3623628.1 flagellar hook-length control protein FliK [Methylibium sp.]
MNPVDGDRLRALAAASDSGERQPAAQRFEDALKNRQGDQGGGDEQGGDQQQPRQPARAALEQPAMSPNVMHWFRQSLEHDVPDTSGHGPVLDALLEDIAGGVRAGRRLPGDRWRLTVRLRPEVLPLTEADIACVGGELSVAMRTASENAYRVLVDALPALNAALEKRQFGNPRTMVFLIGPEDLQ